MDWYSSPAISKRIHFLVKELGLSYVDASQVHCFESRGSSGRATARIWSLPTIWQQALHTQPAYCLEIISERFNKLSLAEQEKVLIHELLHIPKTFSGSLVPHRNARHRTFRHYHDTIEAMFRSLSKKSYE